MSTLIEELITIIQYDFVIKALIGGVFLAVIGPIFGTFLLAQKSPHYGDSISHIGLFGVLLASVMGWNIYLITIGVSVAASLVVTFLKVKIQSEAVLVVLTVCSLALISIFNRFTQVNLDSLLFGSLLNISSLDLTLIISLTVVMMLSFILFYRHIINILIFGNLSKLSGTPFTITRYGVSIALGLFVAVSIQIFGALLISGILIFPPLIVQNFELNLKTSFIFSSFFGFLGLISGLVVSILFDIPAGGAIIIIMTLFLLFSSILSGRKNTPLE